MEDTVDQDNNNNNNNTTTQSALARTSTLSAAAPWPKPHIESRKPVVSTPTGMRGVAGERYATKTPRPTASRDGNNEPRLGVKWPSRKRKGSVAAKPIVPMSERRSLGDGPSWRNRRDADMEKTNITPDGGSAGREGRQFTVANVGNNGRIYLRPTIRPAYQRLPQPSFVFPMTPPGTASIDALAANKPGDVDAAELLEKQGTSTPTIPTPSSPVRRTACFSGLGPETQPGRKRRALSDTITHKIEDGAFKIVISKVAEDKKKSTTTDALSPHQLPVIDVTIPSWKLGTPRFSKRGTAFFRGSSYAPTEDFSSNISVLDRSRRESTSLFPPSLASRRSLFLLSPHILIPGVGELRTISPRLSLRPSSTTIPSHSPVEPDFFDHLTFKPDCDDRFIVRYAPMTGIVTAATPPRLVAEITSPNFLDYELISDFFLTYRAFLQPVNLLQMLVSRWRWTLRRHDETGTVCRVRTFVALRHWILNYFMDDFLVDRALRVSFCQLLNDVVDELSEDARIRKMQVKILAELKKCWRRICAQFWQGPEFQDNPDPYAPILPGGGAAGISGSSADLADFNSRDHLPPRLDELFAQKPNATQESSFYADVSRAGHIPDSVVIDNRPSTPEHPADRSDGSRRQTSPNSILSLEAVSCSFTGKNLRAIQANHPTLAAHPVTTSSIYTVPTTIATTPRSLVGKKIRPSTHRRNNSLSDSLREHATDKAKIKDQETVMTGPFAGSLVRGDLLPPSQAFVDILPPSVSAESRRQSDFFTGNSGNSLQVPRGKEHGSASAMSAHGMKKLISSVRRALSTRGQGGSQGQGLSLTQGTFMAMSPLGPRGATTNRLPGTPIVPQDRARQFGQLGQLGQMGRPVVRIDLLGAEVAEDFKKAVRDDQAADVDKRAYSAPSGSPVRSTIRPGTGRTSGSDARNSLSRLRGDAEAFAAGTHESGTLPTPMRDTSQDTLNLPVLTGAISNLSPSIEAFADTLLSSAAGPTPPTTPPNQDMGTPRRSSYLLNRYVMRPSPGTETMHQFTPNSYVGNGNSQPRLSQDFSRSSSASSRLPPVSLGFKPAHNRQLSSRNQQSLNSFARRRAASLRSNSSIAAYSAAHNSFTASDSSQFESVPMPPQPLRMLRRRPGGNLRAVKLVGDLNDDEMRRSRSLGSLTTFTDSVRSSILRSPTQNDFSDFVDVVASEGSQGRPEAFSLGAMTEPTPKAKPKPKRDMALISTHSSKPAMRPSFEAEARRLAEIPDDEEDCGIEAALAKLEGKFEKKTLKLSMEPRTVPGPGVPPPLPLVDPSIAKDNIDMEGREKKGHRQLHVTKDAIMALSPDPSIDLSPDPSLDPSLDPSIDPSVSTNDNHAATQSSLRAQTFGNSHTSLPLRDGDDTSNGVLTRPPTQEANQKWADMSVLRGPDNENLEKDQSKPKSSLGSYEIVEKTQSVEQIVTNSHRPEQTGASRHHEYIIQDESDRSSELSSEMSTEVLESDNSVLDDGFPVFRPATSAVESKHLILNAPPPGPPPTGALPSPPMTQPPPHLATETANVPRLYEEQIYALPRAFPPTLSTVAPNGQRPFESDSPRDPTGTAEALRNAPSLEADQSNKYSAHLPFILAFGSEILAQQFTLIEKDALNEVEWRELIELSWKRSGNGDVRSWVHFLRDSDAHGVEVVIARFNVMVKWAISEVVLTVDMEERARCIIKLIHIAAHCRRYRNFATMSQIAVALSSKEISGLGATWELIPAADMTTLRELERLVSPTRNFYGLRAEMEAGSDTGCIPFVGIYTHDLSFNAQRPSEIASSPDTAPMVNFERWRCAAGVVKTLLRLLEASSLYDFQPIEGITERCLWVGALSDEAIKERVAMLV